MHEFSHAAVGCCTGARIESVTVEPNEGGLTRMRGGIPSCTLPAGYLGSSLVRFCATTTTNTIIFNIDIFVCNNQIGALLIFAGFDTRAVCISLLCSNF